MAYRRGCKNSNKGLVWLPARRTRVPGYCSTSACLSLTPFRIFGKETLYFVLILWIIVLSISRAMTFKICFVNPLYLFIYRMYSFLFFSLIKINVYYIRIYVSFRISEMVFCCFFRRILTLYLSHFSVLCHSHVCLVVMRI